MRMANKMILTVTLNTALDKVLFIDEWLTGLPMRTDRIVTSVGGKGLDSSVVLRHLGVDTVGLCFVAGEAGQALVNLTRNYGIVPEPIWVDGETRIAHVIVERRFHRHSHIIAGALKISSEHCQQFLDKFSRHIGDAAYVICAGSIPPVLPPEFYATLTQIAHEHGVPLLIDSQNFGITGALSASPDVIKMNWDEFERTFELKAPDLDALIGNAIRLRTQHNLHAIVLTLAENGILAFTPQGNYHALAPRQQAVNAAGAGDAVSSALAWRLTMGETWHDALHWAAAVSAATVLTEGTADCHMPDIQNIYPQVTIKTLAS
jgi:1-phosphofructokinase family hexose kinase